jgi:hypothetical protein
MTAAQTNGLCSYITLMVGSLTIESLCVVACHMHHGGGGVLFMTRGMGLAVLGTPEQAGHARVPL